MTYTGSLTGFTIYVTELGYDLRQVRCPRSKCRRIRRKWAKQDKNWKRFPRRGIYQIAPHLLVCDAQTYAEISTLITEEDNR